VLSYEQEADASKWKREAFSAKDHHETGNDNGSHLAEHSDHEHSAGKTGFGVYGFHMEA
jgi:hypothetical protein